MTSSRRSTRTSIVFVVHFGFGVLVALKAAVRQVLVHHREFGSTSLVRKCALDYVNIRERISQRCR
jgi:hypothetical protein